ncbi:MAG: DUF4286 family protein [Bacteroidetes bacterium]|nr:MAG: DUF4286 family protein [Bacteroidota bacterium]MBL1143926.1 DUF4286 family protein [Bacteroidota bacterium]MCB0802365.1 DUF4286 family protein [Flavobacteriales bacterium]NOG56727.1 DUF4286 family protein [Bacteroidota bacterium]
MIVYSVTINVEDDIHKEWLTWMKETHIPDVMETGFFIDNRFLKVISHNAEETGQTYNIQYSCPSMKDLHQYQAHHAPRLQKEHNDKFEGRFVAFRTLLEKA